MARKHYIKANLVAIAVVITGGLSTYFLANLEYQRQQSASKANVLNQLSTIRAKLEGAINSSLLLTDALVAYTVMHPDLSQAEFTEYAKNIATRKAGIRSLDLARDSVISHIYPYTGNEKAIGINLEATPLQKEAVQRSIRDRQSIIAGPVNLVQGGVAFINRTPIFITNTDLQTGAKVEKYWGQASILVDTEAVYNQAGLDQLQGLNLAIRGRDGLGEKGETFWGDASLFSQDPILLSVSLPTGSWQLAALPQNGWQQTSLILWIWLVGTILSLLAAGLMFILVSEPERLRIAIAQATHDLEIAVQSLQNEIVERKRVEEERHQAEIALRESEVKLAQSQAEVDITRRLQQMLLPQDQELQAIPFLDIAGFMEPAAEVGGDYYDVLQQNGRVKIGIGDVTGHGLESGMLMIMVQMAVRTLLAHDEVNPIHFLNTINLALYGNIQRMQVDRNLTLTLLDYADGKVKITGQHEDVILVRADGRLERLDTSDLGFPIGLESDISLWINEAFLDLAVGDLLVLYTDGVTEAINDDGKYYGVERLCEVVIAHRDRSALAIRQVILDSFYAHVGNHKVYDDITLLVIKQL